MKNTYHIKTTFVYFLMFSSLNSNYYIEGHYSCRQTEFNTLPKETRLSSEHTAEIIRIVSDERVSENRAPLEEKRIVLKAVMATVLVHGGSDKYKLPRKQLDEEHRLYKHFKILSLSEELSCELIKHILNKNGIGYLDEENFKNYWNNYKQIDEYGEITHEMFLLWFNEALLEHNDGFCKLPDNYKTENTNDTNDKTENTNEIKYSKTTKDTGDKMPLSSAETRNYLNQSSAKEGLESKKKSSTFTNIISGLNKLIGSLAGNSKLNPKKDTIETHFLSNLEKTEIAPIFVETAPIVDLKKNKIKNKSVTEVDNKVDTTENYDPHQITGQKKDTESEGRRSTSLTSQSSSMSIQTDVSEALNAIFDDPDDDTEEWITDFS